jgi:GDP-4-dehydro-6-deoxy-D-mannose reductase
VAAGTCEAVIARAFAHSGPRQTPRMMLPQWAEQFACGSGPVQVFSRNVTLDLTDVRDVVRAYRLLLLRGRSGAVYNVGTGAPRLSGEVLELLRDQADPQRRREIVELHPSARLGLVADVTRINREIGWSAEIPLEQTVADTWAWWRDRAAQQQARGPIA